MSVVTCSVCNRLQRISTKERKYILLPELYVCSWQCTLDWIYKPRSFPCHPVNMWNAFETEPMAYPLFRSDYERRCSEDLSARGIPWLYESYSFRVGESGAYTPDFWLPLHGCFLETKGIWWTSQRKKFKKFLEQYPTVPIMLVNWMLKDEMC